MQDPRQLLMPQALARWMDFPPESRRALLEAAARAVRQAWRDGHDVGDLPLALLLYDAREEPATARFPPLPDPDAHRPPEARTLREAVSRWMEELLTIASAQDVRFFGRSVFAALPADQAEFHCRRAEETARDRRRLRTAGVYGRHLAAGGPVPTQGLCGHWHDEPLASPLDVLEAIRAAEAAPDAKLVKAGPAIQAIRSVLKGRNVLIKRFTLPPGWSRIRYRFRASRGRRAWAAAKTLRDCGIETPAPLGFLEVMEGAMPSVSYAVTEWLTGADTAYRWMKHVYNRLAPAERAAARAEIRQALLSLYRNGLYHSDTKLMNLLVVTDAAGRRRWSWIDLESLEAGCRIGRRKLVRNLVQLNGSARHWIPEEDRIDFLKGLAEDYATLKARGLADLIRERTRRRLLRERSGSTPPDGIGRR